MVQSRDERFEDVRASDRYDKFGNRKLNKCDIFLFRIRVSSDDWAFYAAYIDDYNSDIWTFYYQRQLLSSVIHRGSELAIAFD